MPGRPGCLDRVSLGYMSTDFATLIQKLIYKQRKGSKYEEGRSDPTRRKNSSANSGMAVIITAAMY